MADARSSLADVRARIDEVDAAILALVDERARLASDVAAAKAAEGNAGKFGLRPAREAQVLRKLLAKPRTSASISLIVRIWREMMAESLALQGPFLISAWGGHDPARIRELARLRFGAAPSLMVVQTAEDAIAAARALGGVGVLALSKDSAWWGRLLAEPKVRVFAALPCLNAWGSMSALAVADAPIEPSGCDETFWVTDHGGSSPQIIQALAKDGVAASHVQTAGGLKLFKLAGFYEATDERLKRAPGKLSGVIGAAPTPLDV